MAFDRVSAIGLAIDYVIQQIDRAGYQAEGQQRFGGGPPDGGVEPKGEQRRCIHQQVLGPLTGPAACD